VTPQHGPDGSPSATTAATVLVVDDNATNRALLSRILQQDHRRVVEASNGAEALGLARVEQPDLVVTDVLMPKVDGYELERQLRGDPRTADIPVVFHTAAYTDHEVRAMVGQSDRLRVLPKPADVQQIRTTVTEMLARYAAHREAALTDTGEHQHLALLNEKLLQKVRELELADRERQRLLAQLVGVQEDERERIAGEIHDDSIQVMTAVAMRLEMLLRTVTDPEVRERGAKLQETVRAAISRLRHLLFELHPAALDRDGLAAAIDLYLEHNSLGVLERYVVEDNLTGQPQPELRVLLYRIVQEAIRNALKHAGAATVEVRLVEQDDGVLTTVRDDGRGFVVEDALVPRHGHLGLRSMRQRAELAGGWWRVDSGPGRGTVIEAWVPDGGWIEA
jgi:signal transduction histidine kinase